MGGISNLRVLPFRNCFVGVALQIVPCTHGFFCNCAVLLELEYQQSNVVHHAGNEQCGYGVEYANLLAPGIRISFNQIDTGSWPKGDSSFFPERMLTLNFCIGGRCDVSLAQNRYAIVKEQQVCVSTIRPTKDFYYPGKHYYGIQFYLDLSELERCGGQDFLTLLGIPLYQLRDTFCSADGLYMHHVNDAMLSLVQDTWISRDELDFGQLRYFMVQLLHELLTMPSGSEPDAYFTRSQITIVREAESLILSDLCRSKENTNSWITALAHFIANQFRIFCIGNRGKSRT